MNKKVSFQLLVELRRLVREENEIEKNESEDGVVEHSKVQELESRNRKSSVRNFEPRVI